MISSFLWLPVHDFHLSKSLVEYSEADKALQISLYVFIDDLEEALRQNGADNLFIGTEKEDASAEKHMAAYFQNTFKIHVDDKEKQFEFLGKELSEDMIAVWCYLEIGELENLKTLKIKNSLLMEVFNDQTNMVTVKGPGNKRGGFLFQKGNDEGRMAF